MALLPNPKLLFLLFFLILSIFLACQCDEEEKNPYLFESHRFKSLLKSKHGEIRVLEKFTERSELLRGIDKYRIGVLELEPQSFMLPHHCDAEVILLIVRGRGTISIAEQDEKNSFNLEYGDVIRVSAGSTFYFINRDNKERCFAYGLVNSVNIPGQFQEYFSAGGENPESIYRAFSSDILETAFNTPRDRLERLFGQQKEGIVIKASEEQIRAISEHASHSTKQTKGETKGPFNILKERALITSRFGQLFVASPERFEQLRDLNTAVAFLNINQGGMILPVYHTKTTWLVMVTQGNGLFEMVGSQSQLRVRSCVSVGDFFVIPAGHPITAIATGDSNLRTVAFGINALNNKMNFLAGQKSIWRNVDREAKEMSFNMPAREVEEILQKQHKSYFVTGPEQRQQQQYVSSNLDFVF